MKKIILFFILGLFSLYTVMAECSIEHETSEALTSFFDANRKAIGVVLQAQKKQNTKKGIENEASNKYYQVKGTIIRGLNSGFRVGTYFSETRFLVDLPLFHETSNEVRRDYEKIKEQEQVLKEALVSIAESGSHNVKIEDFCDNFKGVSCFIPKKIEADTLIGRLIQNNNMVKEVYLASVMGEKVENYSISLVEKNFLQAIQTHYSPQANADCSNKEGGFGYNVNKAIENISVENLGYKEGSKKWKDAWDLLMGRDSSEETYQELEKQLLREELSRQGVSGDNQTNMLESLDKYNKTGLSENNNPIANTFRGLESTLGKQLQEFYDETLDDFLKTETQETAKGGKEDAKKVTHSESERAKENANTSIEIKKQIDEMYIQQTQYEAIAEKDEDNLQSAMINLHMEISDSINTLEKSCKKAVKICNQQDAGNGKCGSCW